MGVDFCINLIKKIPYSYIMSRAPALGYIYSLKNFAATLRAARLNDVVTMNYVSSKTE